MITLQYTSNKVPISSSHWSKETIMYFLNLQWSLDTIGRHAHTHTHAHTCTHTHTHTHMHTRTCTHTHTHTHTMHTHAHACTHMHTHMHMHAHAHTHTHMLFTDIWDSIIQAELFICQFCIPAICKHLSQQIVKFLQYTRICVYMSVLYPRYM